MRGLVCGLMTTIGGIFHTLPYLVPDRLPNAFYIATAIAAVIVLIELARDLLDQGPLHGHAAS